MAREFRRSIVRNSDKLSPIKRKTNAGTEARIRFTPDRTAALRYAEQPRTRNLGRPAGRLGSSLARTPTALTGRK